MVTIKNVSAFRLASFLALQTKNNGSAFGFIRLGVDGSLTASDTLGMVHSVDAHDAVLHSDLFIRPSKVIASATVHVRIDVGDGVIVEERARSEVRLPAEVKYGLSYPDVSKYLSTDSSRELSGLVFDCIRAGKIADHYGFSRGVFVESKCAPVLELRDTQECDRVILAPMQG